MIIQFIKETNIDQSNTKCIALILKGEFYPGDEQLLLLHKEFGHNDILDNFIMDDMDGCIINNYDVREW